MAWSWLAIPMMLLSGMMSCVIWAKGDPQGHVDAFYEKYGITGGWAILAHIVVRFLIGAVIGAIIVAVVWVVAF